MNEMTHQQFRPAWWLYGGHPQTLWRKFAPIEPLIHSRQRIELDDGDFIDLDWVGQPADPQHTDRIVFLLHGLCGCSGSSYILALQQLLTARGVASVAMNFRGCSGEANRLARAYHSGVSEDVEAVFQKLSAQYANSEFMFVGYSLGANVLLKWLGEHDHAQVSRGVALSTPFSLALCSRAMLGGLSKWYGRYFLNRLVQDFNAKKLALGARDSQTELAKLDALGDLDQLRTIWEFDDRITAPLHGFANAEDYYSRCSSGQFLASIGVETHLIQSTDDPLIPPAALPDAARLPANINLHTSSRGGHVGFIASPRAYWLENTIATLLQAH